MTSNPKKMSRHEIDRRENKVDFKRTKALLLKTAIRLLEKVQYFFIIN